MMELIQNSTFSLLGIWVTVSFLSGLLVYLLIKIFDSLYPNQSSSDRYHKAIAGLVFFFFLNIASTFVFNDHINSKNEKTSYQEVESVHELASQSSFSNGIQERKAVIESEKSDFMTSNLIFKSLGIFWLIGAFVFSIKMIGGYYYTRNLIKQYHESIPRKWNIFIQDQLRQLKIEREVKVFESQRITSALTFGFVKPLIALPIGFFTSLPADQIEAVLLHELYHIKHKDYLINLLTMTFEVIFFYHPLMWWLAKSIRAERENRCDDQVTQILDKQVYAHALLNMEHYRQSLSYAIPFLNKQSNLKMRIMRIFEQKPERNVGLKPFLSLLMIAIFLMGFTFYKLEEPKKKSIQEEISEPNLELAELESSKETEGKVLFKLENSRFGLILEMTKNTLIAKSEKSKVKLYIDEKLYPLNEKISMGKEEIATMYQNEEEAIYHFFSDRYFDLHDRSEWEKENENRNIYIFDRTADFFTFRPAKDFASEPVIVSDEEMEEMISDTVKNSNSISKVKRKSSEIYEVNIPEPIQLQFNDKISQIGDTNNLEVLKKLVRNFSKDENTEVKIKIDGKFIEEGADIEKSLGKREIKNIRIVFPSEDSEIGVIEIITNEVMEGEIKEVSAEEMKNTKILEAPAEEDSISISIHYETPKGNFRGEMKMNVERENVLDVLGDKGSNILFVIDGIEKKLGYQPGMVDIDPNSIESITVLKDKKAIEKYGDKAKNGVVEIYLKKE